MSNALNANERLSSLPTIDIERSRFVRSFKHTTTMNSGDLVPFLVDDVLPGTTLTFDTSFVCRMLTPIHPVMDDAFLDLFYFFVPYRLLWSHWREFNGENRSGYWTQPVQYNIPHLRTQANTTTGIPGFQPKSLADHFGFPTGIAGLSVSQFPFRAYCMIWNEFFRNENTDNPTFIIDGDQDLSTPDATLDNVSALYGGKLLPVARMHDYFSDCLPTAQKLAAPVTIPLVNEPVPVYTAYDKHGVVNPWDGSVQPMHYTSTDSIVSGLPGVFNAYYTSDGAGGLTSSMEDSTNGATLITSQFAPDNLYADLSGVSSATINQLREAFAVQRYAERLALGGSRYTEQLKTFYGLVSQDARLQRPEFLGSQRFRINMSQVLQTSETAVTPQGNTSGFSMTAGNGAHVSYSSQEHGILIGLMCIRHERSYQQGVNRCWSRRELFDMYQPPFAHLGNMAVLNKEIYADGTFADDQVFGYQEAWAEYRYMPNVISGEMRSNYAQSLDIWHYGDDYASLPTLSESWMNEGSTEIARTLAITDSSQSDQFLVQLAVPIDTVAPMPLYSVPGLIDHF